VEVYVKKFIVASLLIIMVVLVSSCSSVFQPQPTPTPTLDPESPEITISMDEFTFTPDHIRLVVGQNVTLHVVNNGEEDHEIMIGRNPLRDVNGMLGDGFEHDFFALTDVAVQGDVEVMGMNGEAMSMDMGMETAAPEGDMSMDVSTATPEGDMNMDMGTATPESGMDMGADSMDSGMDMGDMENGGMVMIGPKKEATITFTVTKDMAGTWTIGCFEGGDLKHFDLGMAGILYVRDFGD
jgi:hypothetical protein